MIPASLAINGPTVISFSGGRTSGLMLYRILQAHDGKLPDDVVVIFTNTGKERVETLDFIARCGTEWNVPIVWLERRAGGEVEIVSHNAASRDGEPFEQLIRDRKFLPTAVTWFCTVALKVRPVSWYCTEILGWERWDSMIGLRADEPRRVERMCGRNDSNKDRFKGRAPLADLGITVADVMQFWSWQPFDLQLESYQGNCDLCFLKNRKRLRQIMYEDPHLADWWIRMEDLARDELKAGTGGRFRSPDRPSYRTLFETRAKQEEFPFEFDALDLCTSCTD